MLPLVGASQKRLANARIALRNMDIGVDALIANVPRRLRNDPGLNYERFVWRDRKDYDDSAIEMLLSASKSNESLGRPEKWAHRRFKFAHALMRDGQLNSAYRLASSHHLEDGSDFNRLEWLAGYIALRKLGDPGRAAYHFERFSEKVESPISLGRAGYWLGARI